MCQRELIETHGRAIEWAHPQPITSSLTTQTGGRGDKPPFLVLGNWMEVGKNVNRTHFWIRWLVVKLWNERSCSFRQSPK